jgi:hypothetical protein
MSSSPDFNELPEWVKSLGLPKVPLQAIDRYWKLAQAREVLERVPVHAAQNVTVLDKAGDYATVCLSPDRPPEFKQVPAAAYFPAEGRVEYRWPDRTREQSFDSSREETHTERFTEDRRAA